MLDRLRAKPGGERIPVTLGDFSAVAVTGEFSLIYVVFNTMFNLITQEDQLNCFKNVREHLLPAGVFVIEAFVPDMKRFTDGQNLRVLGLDNDHVRLSAAEIDYASQVITGLHVKLSSGSVEVYPVRLRYIWPSEMDLMARLAGLRLRQRWGSWEQSPFTSTSLRHISIYEKAV
jgi:hypothetical protein